MADVLPPSYSSTPSTSTDTLPAYLPQDADPYSLTTPSKEHDYTYSSRNLTLNLGRKHAGSPYPAYGREASIRGTVHLKSLASIKALTVTISGIASFSLIEKGQSCRHRQRYSILQQTIPLWTSSTSNRSSPLSHLHGFSLPLPTTARASTSALPPTINAQKFSNFRINIRYRIQVRVVYKGLRRTDCVGTEFCYLPRSRPRDLPTVSPVYGPRYVKSDRLSQPEVQWKMVPGRAPGKTPAGNMVSAVELGLPLPLSYASSIPIPFCVVLPADYPPIDESRISVQLVKATSFVVDGRFYKFQSVIGSGKYVKTEETDAGSSSDKRREIGELRRDAHGLEAEASWRLANVMEVQHYVRMRVPAVNHLPSFECQQPIHLATNSVRDFDDDLSAWRSPALGPVQEVAVKKKASRNWLKAFMSSRLVSSA